jgi:hypothetical protein
MFYLQSFHPDDGYKCLWLQAAEPTVSELLWREWCDLGLEAG